MCQVKKNIYILYFCFYKKVCYVTKFFLLTIQFYSLLYYIYFYFFNVFLLFNSYLFLIFVIKYTLFFLFLFKNFIINFLSQFVDKIESYVKNFIQGTFRNLSLKFDLTYFNFCRDCQVRDSYMFFPVVSYYIGENLNARKRYRYSLKKN